MNKPGMTVVLPLQRLHVAGHLLWTYLFVSQMIRHEEHEELRSAHPGDEIVKKKSLKHTAIHNTFTPLSQKELH